MFLDDLTDIRAVSGCGSDEQRLDTAKHATTADIIKALADAVLTLDCRLRGLEAIASPRPSPDAPARRRPSRSPAR